jgi:hypothetical protein
MKRLFVVSMVTLLMAGCGDSDSTGPPTQVPTAISLSPTDLTLTVGGPPGQLTATVRDQDGAVVTNASVTWSSSDNASAAVSGQGLVTPLALGLVTITATAGSVSATATVTVLEAASDAQDSGFGVVEPGMGGQVTSDSGWARVTVPPGSTGQPVLIEMELLEEATCEMAGELTQALGCWEIDRYPEGDFQQDVVVEVCVADPGIDVMTDYEYYTAQRLHKQDESTLEITALPLVNSDLDCTEFPLGEGANQQARLAGTESLWGLLASRLGELVLPEPLGAGMRQLRRPPRGLGGLVGSFSRFFGAVPEEVTYESLPIGTGTASNWWVAGQWEGVTLCNGEGGDGCHPGSLTSVEIEVGADDSLDQETPPWWQVYLFYRPSEEFAPATLIGQAAYSRYVDYTESRLFIWTITLEGAGIPEGPIDVFAVGVQDPNDGGGVFGTGLASYITVFPPASGPVTVDGVLSPGEWDNALVIPFDTVRSTGESVNGRFLVTNSPDRLYAAVEVNHEMVETPGSLFDFQLGIAPWHQCEWDHLYGRVTSGTSFWAFDGWTRTAPGYGERCDPLFTGLDEDFFGTDDVEGAFMTGDGRTVIELVRLLNTGDASDIVLERGQEYGATQAWASLRFPDMTYDYFKNPGIFTLRIR